MTPNLREFHRYGDKGTVRWRIDSMGLEIEGEGYQRTAGKPLTMQKIWHEWAEPIQHWAFAFGLPVELLMMTCATEGGMHLDNPKQDRKEPGYVSDEATPDRVSIGLNHILLSTAREVTGWAGMPRRWLEQPANNFMVAALVIRLGARVTRLDPVLVSARYNAGSLRPSPRNRWGLFVHGTHLDRAAKWVGDAVAFTADKGDVERGWRWFLESINSGTLL